MKHSTLLAAVVLALGCDPAPAMTVEAAEVHAGQSVIAAFSPPLGGRASNQFWLQVVPVDRPDSDVSGRVFADHGATTMRLVAPESAGRYEIRLHDRWPARDHHPVARAPLTVRALIRVSEARP
jgi:hypothetical protein